jgi:hypothetical protein
MDLLDGVDVDFARACWRRGYESGYLAGATSALVAVLAEDLRDELLHAFGVSVRDARAIIDQGAHEARLTHPDATDIERRAIAALRACRAIERFVARRIERQEAA